MNSTLEPPDVQPITARLAAAGSQRAEVEALLTAAPDDAGPADLRRLTIDDNVVGKGSAAARVKTWTNMKLRYVLDPAVPEYLAFVAAWRATGNSADRGLLCLLMLARTDRLFREVTLECVTPHLGRAGTIIDATAVRAVVARHVADSGATWAVSTTDWVQRHLLSALKDFGVLKGGLVKRTVTPRPGHTVARFAVQLARWEGLTDRQTLEARWFRLLGLDRAAVIDWLYQAARDGALEFRMQADVVEVALPAPVEDAHAALD